VTEPKVATIEKQKIRRITKMKNRHAMIIGVVAVLLIGGLFIVGCGSTQKKSLSKLAADVCAGDGAGLPEAASYTQTSGLHPVEYVTKKVTGWGYFSYYSTPKEWRTKEVAEVELVACIVEEQVVLERCPYSVVGGKDATVSRVQVKTVVTLHEAQTGKVVATSEALEGGVPAKCKQSEEFSKGSTSKSNIGLRPSREVDEWLEQYVEIP
jgi:hypothetical protein